MIVKILELIVVILILFESNTSTFLIVFSYFNKLIQQIGEILWDFTDNIQQLI